MAARGVDHAKPFGQDRYMTRTHSFCIAAASLVLATTLSAQGASRVSWPAGYADGMARAHAGDGMFATMSHAPAPSADVTGEAITYGTAQDGTPLKGYLARPTQGGPYPGI